MSLRVIKCSTVADLTAFLKGAVTTRQIDRGLYGLVGKTLIFTTPASATCTFVAGTHDEQHVGFLTVAEIITQLTGAVSGLAVGTKDRALVLTSDTGIVLTGGTARELFGLSTSVESKGVAYAAPGGSPPMMVTCYFAEGAHVLIVDDA